MSRFVRIEVDVERLVDELHAYVAVGYRNVQPTALDARRFT